MMLAGIFGVSSASDTLLFSAGIDLLDETLTPVAARYLPFSRRLVTV
jgi:hypothetical protein